MPVRRRRWRPGARPPWWPAGEPWPPAGAERSWRYRRRPFFLLIPLVGLLVLVGFATLIDRLAAVVVPGGADRPLAPILIGVGLFFVAMIALLRSIARPIGDIVEAADRVARGDLDVRVAPQGPPPLRVVGTAFNTMAERLAAQERQRRDLLAEIAHELRTPLSVMQGKLEGVLDGLYERDDATLNGLVDEVRLLSRLVEDLRLLSIAESGALTLQKEPTDVALLMNDVAASFAAEAAARHLVLTAEPAGQLPSIDADPVRLRQVLANLVANALRHTTHGVVTIKATVDGSWLSISVKDTGAGMSPEELPRIFDRFYRGGSSKGSGLGLTIARNLTQAHGGRLDAQSVPGSGTTMAVRLPLAGAPR